MESEKGPGARWGSGIELQMLEEEKNKKQTPPCTIDLDFMN